jgi:glycosyltransferase involved in cell wall biosynthesis
MDKKILLICYSYPPYPGTGGRRWAKLSKYLAWNGNTIHVINATPHGDERSVWEKDTLHPNISVHPVSNTIEKLRDTFKPGFMSKLIYKTIFFLCRIKTKANYSDQSVWWADKAYQKAKEICASHKIDHVIVSCPPYHIMDKMADLKKEFPQVKLVLDYRDLWIIGQTNKGFFSHLSDTRFGQEAQKEKKAIDAADLVLTVADEMTNGILEKYSTKKVYTVHNGFDEDDFDPTFAIDPLVYINPEKTNIIFAGSLVEGSNPYAIPFFTALAKLKQDDPASYSALHFCVFGNVNPTIKQLIETHELDISFFLPLSSKAIGRLYAEFDYLLLFLLPYYRFAFISKFFDYLPARKPIISISETGTFSQFLEDNKLGKNIEPQDSYEALVQLLSKKNRVSIDDTFDVSTFSYRKSATRILELLNDK